MVKRSDLSKFFQEHYQTGVGAEIGCQRGEFSKQLGQDYKGKILSIDYFDPTDLEYNPQTERLCRSNLKNTNCQVIKGRSIDVSLTVPDISLDWIYIDADHRYSGIKADLNAWFPKVRPGGVVSGHDYIHYVIGEYVFGVIEAVNEFCHQHGYHIAELLDAKKFPTWYFIK